MKTPGEIESKIAEMCAIDATKPPAGVLAPVSIGFKTGAVKALLWALGVNDDDRFYITATPGKPLNTKERLT